MLCIAAFSQNGFLELPLIETSADKEWGITLEKGYSVEYVTKDGNYGWSTMWEPLDTWNYGQLNPCKIDLSNMLEDGFLIDTYRVTDMNIPDGYYLPEKYLDIKYKESNKGTSKNPF